MIFGKDGWSPIVGGNQRLAGIRSKEQRQLQSAHSKLTFAFDCLGATFSNQLGVQDNIDFGKPTRPRNRLDIAFLWIQQVQANSVARRALHRRQPNPNRLTRRLERFPKLTLARIGSAARCASDPWNTATRCGSIARPCNSGWINAILNSPPFSVSRFQVPRLKHAASRSDRPAVTVLPHQVCLANADSLSVIPIKTGRLRKSVCPEIGIKGSIRGPQLSRSDLQLLPSLVDFRVGPINASNHVRDGQLRGRGDVDKGVHLHLQSCQHWLESVQQVELRCWTNRQWLCLGQDTF